MQRQIRLTTPLLLAATFFVGCAGHVNPLPGEVEPPTGWDFDENRAAHPVKLRVTVRSVPDGAIVYFGLGYRPRRGWFDKPNALRGIEKGFDWPRGNLAGIAPLDIDIIDKGYSMVYFSFVMPDRTEYQETFDHVPTEVIFKHS